MPGERSPLSLFGNPEFVAAASARFARGMTVAVVVIALALYADRFAATGVVAGLFGTAYALARFVLILPIGRLIDVRDGKRLLTAGLAVNAAILVGYMGVGAVEHVVALRALQGAGSALLFVSATSVLGEVAPAEDRGRWLGTAGQVKSAAGLVGDVVGGGLLFVYGFVTTYAVLVAVTALAALLVVAFVRGDPGGGTPGGRTGVETYRRLFARGGVRALVAFRFAFSFGKTAVLLFLPIFARTEFGMTSLAIGGILAGGRITKTLAQGYVGGLADRVGNRAWFVLTGALVYALGTAAFPFALAVAGLFDPVAVPVPGGVLRVGPAWAWLFGCYVGLGAGDSLRLPASYSLFVAEGAAHDAVAGSLSVRSLSWQVGAAVGPLAFGAALDLVSFYAAFWLAAGVVVLAGAVFASLVPHMTVGDAVAAGRRGGAE